MKSKRFEVLSQRPVNQDGYVKGMGRGRFYSHGISSRSKT